jgi:hypothetical protein
MGNTDWWTQPTQPQNAVEQHYAQQAARIERQWEVEARALEATIKRRKQTAWALFGLGAGSLLLGLGGLALPDLFPSPSLMLSLGVALFWAGTRQIMRTV